MVFNKLLKTVHSVLFIFIISSGFAQKVEKSVLSGYVRDAKTGEELIGVSVVTKENGKGTATNEYGFFSLSLSPGTYNISVKYVGYTTLNQVVDLSTSQKLNIELTPQTKELKTINVTGERKDENLKTTEMSTNRLDMKAITKIPALLGEVDLIKSIQLLPGVSTVGEGASGFNVRGGSIDQNLILLDEAPVYNSSHLL